MTPETAALMSKYNSWMNHQIYSAAHQLPPSEVSKNRGAFFGSIIGTLNHIAVGDTIWLHRFAVHPARFCSLTNLDGFPPPESLKEILFPDLPSLWSHRQKLDRLIEQFAEEIDEEALSQSLKYGNATRGAKSKNFGFLLQHFFNHQTHHRGQVSTLLFQAGIDVGVTDLLAVIPSGDS
jgi:uncharacterized damage-inducible protein DinB